MLPDTAVLRGRLIADNYVTAIRLNGKNLPVPQREEGVFDLFTDFSAGKGFVQGTNALEIDVHNGGPPESEPDPERGPMGLRVELSGSVMCGQSDHRAGLPRKEGAAMN